MSKAYRIRPDGSTEPLNRIRVRNEEQDLQRLLEQNPDLLAGDQIRPEDPCRWLLVDREIAVPDPESGSDRWSLDLFFVDQRATPTLVECKRFEDTRSRREVVAQMLDYAANAVYYWEKDELCAAARATAEKSGSDLETQLGILDPEWDDGEDAFFQRVEDNLRESQLRLVFFLEEAPWQLRSIVEFLNRQMERTEVLLIEARQYEDGESRIIVPSLFGFTDEARRVKRTVSVNSGKRKKWDRELYLAAMDEQFGSEIRDRAAYFLDELIGIGAEIAWGVGAKTGSASPKWTSVTTKALVTLYTDGKFYINAPTFKAEGGDRDTMTNLIAAIEEHTELVIPDNCYDKCPQYTADHWVPSIDGIVAALRSITAKD